MNTTNNLITLAGNILDIDWDAHPTPQAIITSPPYWAKRRYPIPDIWIGGSNNCLGHKPAIKAPPPRNRSIGDTDANNQRSRASIENYDAKASSFCECGAWFGQLGMEPTPALYVEHLADILDSLPLAADGCLFVNIDDTWINSGGGQPKAGTIGARKTGDKTGQATRISRQMDNDMKPKDLALVPERLALAMQDKGWYVRARIVWHKTNGMPSSVRDRPPHEYETIWMFTKSARYKYKADAVSVSIKDVSLARAKRGVSSDNKYLEMEGVQPQTFNKPRANEKYKADSVFMSKTGLHSQEQRQIDREKVRTKRAIRDVWSLSTAASSYEHIAPMPAEIARRAILLSTDPGDLVLDPFAGTGTTGKVAMELGRCAMCVDLDARMTDWLHGVQVGLEFP